ncbi:MAG: ASKHA domain-containing protein, partial [Vulcanisaeta sp.]
MQAIWRAGLGIRTECGGFGICGKDRVIIIKGNENLNSLTKSELEHLTKDEVNKGYRLACQARVFGDVTIYIPEESRVKPTERKVSSQGFMRQISINPIIKVIKVQLPPPSLEDQRPDFDRLVDTLRNIVKLNNIKPDNIKIDLNLLKDLPFKLRTYNWYLNVILWDDEIISIEPGALNLDVYGVGVDIGTSKIVVHLINLSTGEIKAVKYMENPQLAYGEDIITRMTFAEMNPNNPKTLQNLVINAINELIEKAARDAKVPLGRIFEIMIVGNTTMHHFFLGLPTKFLGKSPFLPVTGKLISVKAKELGLKGHPKAYVTVLPNIAGFVGADAIADALATGIMNSKENVILVDIGTNTEIFVGNSDRMVACSAPSGPAFEGAHIRFGIKAVNGAIERVKIYDDGEVEYSVIGDEKPKGLTGSAVIDAIAELFRRGIIDSRGKFRKNLNLRRLRKYEEGWGYVIAWASETATYKDIVLFERDISEIILAKAAIYAGISVAMARRQNKPEDVSSVFIAGSFGNHVDPLNAKIIGMIPD